MAWSNSQPQPNKKGALRPLPNPSPESASNCQDERGFWDRPPGIRVNFPATARVTALDATGPLGGRADDPTPLRTGRKHITTPPVLGGVGHIDRRPFRHWLHQRDTWELLVTAGLAFHRHFRRELRRRCPDRPPHTVGRRYVYSRAEVVAVTSAVIAEAEARRWRRCPARRQEVGQ